MPATPALHHFHVGSTAVIDANRLAKSFDQKRIVKPEDPMYTVGEKPEHKDYDEDDRVIREPTAFRGNVRFFGSTKPAKPYLVLSDDSHPGKVRVMLEKQWGLLPPDLLISVTGGAMSFKSPHPKLEEIFRRAMMRAAIGSNAWIVTGGTNSGVMQLVGKAVDDYGSCVPVIGITPWGVIPNQEDMRTRSDGKSCTFQTHDQKNRVWPDPNHTHFLWVDNGRKDCWGAEVDLRSKIETAICSPAMKWEDNGPKQGLQNGEKRHRACSSSMARRKQAAAAEFVDLDRPNSIPCVCIAYEGGPGTILTVYTEVKQNIAVVVVNGSGRCCDVFCYAAKHVEKLRSLVGAGKGEDEIGEFLRSVPAEEREWFKQDLEVEKQLLALREEVREKQAQVDKPPPSPSEPPSGGPPAPAPSPTAAAAPAATAAAAAAGPSTLQAGLGALEALKCELSTLQHTGSEVVMRKYEQEFGSPKKGEDMPTTDISRIMYSVREEDQVR
jgi:hypothetical protein